MLKVQYDLIREFTFWHTTENDARVAEVWQLLTGILLSASLNDKQPSWLGT